MASFFVVSLNRGKLSHLFFGLCKIPVMLGYAPSSGCKSFVGTFQLRACEPGHPEASISSPVLASSSASNALVASTLIFLTVLVDGVELHSYSGVSGSGTQQGRAWCTKAGSLRFNSLSCCCTKKWSAHLVMPRPRGNLWGMAG